MAGEKLSPRQKMIGMMYLVLTAMLALNISKEVLLGFVKVNDKLGASNKTITGQSNAIWTSFQNKNASNPQKVGPFYKKAEEVIQRSDDMIQLVKNVQAFSIAASEKNRLHWDEYIAMDEDLGADTVLNILHVKKKDEYQELTASLVGSNPNQPKSPDERSPFSANDLKEKLLAYKDFLNSTQVTMFTGQKWSPTPGFIQSAEKSFSFPDGIEDGKEKKWEVINFYDVPLAAVITYLSSLQLDVENAKANMLSELLSGVEGKDYKFTNLTPLVIPQSNYIMRGDTFRADVLLAAYDASNAPRIYIDSQSFDGNDSTMYVPSDGEDPIGIGLDGLGKLKIPTNSLSMQDHSFKGLIKYKGPTGEWQDWPFYIPAFTVAEPALVVEPTKMNVFYRGLENPVSIAVPGVPADKINPSCPGHTLTRGKGSGEWVIKPGNSKEAKISVRATMPDGSEKTFPAKDFRVKPIPDPVPTFGGKTPTDNSISRGDFTVSAGVRADMKDFEFDVKVTVTSFSMGFSKSGEWIQRKSNSNRVSGDMQELMKQAKRGEKVFIEDIRVKMPDGKERKLANISLRIT
jgi:gliding motility-associated protein GldM